VQRNGSSTKCNLLKIKNYLNEDLVGLKNKKKELEEKITNTEKVILLIK